MLWEPNSEYLVAAARNRRPGRLPIYEHHIAPEIMAQALGVDMTVPGDGASAADFQRFYANQARFWREMTYDTFSFEAAIVGSWDDSGAIMGGRPGPIQNRATFESFPFEDVPKRFWRKWTPHLEALAQSLPDGMKAIGGSATGSSRSAKTWWATNTSASCGSTIPSCSRDLYRRIGDMVTGLWSRLLKDYGELFAVCRMGDDLGYQPAHAAAPHHHPSARVAAIPPRDRSDPRFRKPFLWHTCGCIFAVMDDVIARASTPSTPMKTRSRRSTSG